MLSTQMLGLPPEIWLQIVELATAVPSELNTDACSLFERCTHRDAHRERLSVLPTRRSLPLVSRAFYRLANQRLYKSILVRTSATLESLLETLRNAPKIQGPDGKLGVQYGQWVKRLDIKERSRPYSTRAGLVLPEILSYLPSIEIFVVCGGGWAIEDNLLGWVTTYLPNIKRLSLPQSRLGQLENLGGQSISASLRTFEPVALVLRLVDMPKPGALPDYNQGKEIRAISAPRSPQTMGDTDPVYFPRLRTLHLFPPVDTTFLKVHGHKITTLDIEASSWSAAYQYMEFFPNVRSIILDLVSLHPYYYRLWNDQVWDCKVPNIELVGLTVNSSQARHRLFNGAFSILPSLFCNLKRLRILERTVVDKLVTQTNRVIAWHASLAAQHVRLEREDGELLIRSIYSQP